MANLVNLMEISAFSLPQTVKDRLLSEVLRPLTSFHYSNCSPYRKMLDMLEYDTEVLIHSCSQIPFLPVSLFKKMELRSITDEHVFKTLYSSGTSTQPVSKIYLDKETAIWQQKALVKTVADFTGMTRSPMLIIDNPNVLKNRNAYSARGAAILGFSLFGADRCFALNDNGELDIAAIENFLEKHKGKQIFIFGFTFLIWHYFYRQLKRLNQFLNLENAILIHGGGWKKLQNESVSNSEFKQGLKETCGIESIHDYYGMVEQTGSISLECASGNFHAGIFSDIIIRRPDNFKVCDFGEEGLIQVISVLPKSYCGHSLLTEDVGTMVGTDDCPCGRPGNYFKVHGRMKQAELRGCSDTYEL